MQLALSHALLRTRIIGILALGFASGLPLALITSTLTIRLAEAHISNSSLGTLALATVPYSVKFLWAIFLDNFTIPFLTKKIGFRRSWLILSQFFLLISIVILGKINPTNVQMIVLSAFFVGFFSATQDIAIDAYRIEILEEDEQGIGATMAIYGYRIAMLVSGAGALFLADYLYDNWSFVYNIMGSLILLGTIAAFIIGEPKFSSDKIERLKLRTFEWTFEQLIQDLIISPLLDFTKRNHWLLILVFIVLFKLSDSFLSIMANKFYIDMGFSKKEIASIVKLYGFSATIVGLGLGGLISYKIGIGKSLLIACILQMLSNLVFIMQISSPHDLYVLAFIITIENICGSIGNITIVAYLSSLCNISYTATQYALLSSLSSLGRSIFATSSGLIVDLYGWVYFFIISSVIGIPSLIALYYLYKKNVFSTKALNESLPQLEN